MRVAIIITTIILIYFAFSTIFFGTRLAGKIGTIVGGTNLELFGYMAYINIILLFYPLYSLYNNPTLVKRVDFYAGWLLLLLSIAVFPALVFDMPHCGLLSHNIYEFLVPYIGKAGMWFFWMMIMMLSVTLILDDEYTFDDFLDQLSDRIEQVSAFVQTLNFPRIRTIFEKIFSNPFAPSGDDIPQSNLSKIRNEPIKTAREMPKLKPSSLDDLILPSMSDHSMIDTREVMVPKNEPKKGRPRDDFDLFMTVEEEFIPEPAKAEKKKVSVAEQFTDISFKSLLHRELDDIPAKKEESIAEIAHALNAANHVEIVEELEENSRLLSEIEKGEQEKPKNFKLPKTEFLTKPPKASRRINEAEIDRKIKELLDKLGRFNIEGDVIRTYTGPVVTTFEFKPAPNVKISKILGLQDDLAMALSAETIRIQAPIPGRDVVGIEIPNEKFETIYLRDILESDLFKDSRSPLTMALGKDIVGKPFITDLKKLPHLLIAGTTGSGKSVGINAMLLSLLYRNDPEHLKLVLIDPKMLEFSIYNDIPHLLTPVIIEPKKAISALANLVNEMERRYKLMSEHKVKNIDSFNEKMRREHGPHMPFIVIVIDELADLMMNGGKEVEYSIARLAQMARASGIHLIVATQRPSVDVVTGLIKANLPSRLSYRVGQKIDSKVILDGMGAESLLGRGDGLFTPPGATGLVRIHAPWNSEEEIEEVVEFLKAQRDPDYDESYLRITGSGDDDYEESGGGQELDPLYDQALEIIMTDQKTSISYLQRKLQIGYNRSANIIEQLQMTGVLSAPNNKGNREIL